MILNESFQLAAIIKKLPPLWKDFKNYLKHKRKEMGFEDLIVRLRIEEDNRKSEVKSSKSGMEAKTNLTESSTSKKCKHSGKNKGKAKKFKGNCYNCGKPNHMVKYCRHPKKGNQGGNQQTNVTEDKSVPIDMSELDLTVVVFEANMMDNLREWWIDTGATRHICADKEMFSSYILINGRKTSWGLARLCSRSKDEALVAFKTYKNEVENQLNFIIKMIRSDRGGEYVAPFEEFCSEAGIIHQTICSLLTSI
ncbi:hypothetical protein DH2020_005879 [Rehmannia glutinosa]|uniref:CCHC-type domain-containing protein n=1 Tax=Rehmannia glutinosa TaxID=99300 RepID=A0ABR0XH99_REHGL